MIRRPDPATHVDPGQHLTPGFLQGGRTLLPEPRYVHEGHANENPDSNVKTVRRILLSVLVLLVLAGLAWAAWWVVSRAELSVESEEASDPIRVTASAETRTLERTVTTRGVFGFGAGRQITAGGQGRVTGVSVSVGSIVKAGDVVLEVEGRPMVAMEGARPLWRDLAQGDRGPDVEILQMVLAEQGYLAFDPDGRFGGATRTGLRAWQEDHGFTEADGEFRIDDWLVDSWPGRIGQIMVATGGFLQPGSPLFSVTGEDPSVSVELIPSDRLRVSPGDSARVEVPATGRMVDGTVDSVEVSPVTLDDESVVYPGTIVIDEDLEAPEGTQVRVTIIVDRAVDVVAVPLASLVSDADGSAAVRVVRADGIVETVPVELGLSEGAWVEIVSGLDGDEQVLVAEG